MRTVFWAGLQDVQPGLGEAEAGELTASLAIVRMLRLQQIICGYLPASDDDDTLVPIEGGNPRLSLLAEIAENLNHQFIVWARFKEDLRQIENHPAFRGKCVRVDGDVKDQARADALSLFKTGQRQALVATPDSVGTGYTFTMAKTVIYYSNSFKLIDREQSEDRAHRIGQDNAVNYIDLVARNTMDTRIITNLRNKVSVASAVTGENLREWI